MSRHVWALVTLGCFLLLVGASPRPAVTSVMAVLDVYPSGAVVVVDSTLQDSEYCVKAVDGERRVVSVECSPDEKILTVYQ